MFVPREGMRRLWASLFREGMFRPGLFNARTPTVQQLPDSRASQTAQSVEIPELQEIDLSGLTDALEAIDLSNLSDTQPAEVNIDSDSLGVLGAVGESLRFAAGALVDGVLRLGAGREVSAQVPGAVAASSPVEVSIPETEVVVTSPDISLPPVEPPDITVMPAGVVNEVPAFDQPDIELNQPDILVSVPSLNVQLPDIGVDVPAVEVSVPAAEVFVETPEIQPFDFSPVIETPSLDVSVPSPDISVPEPDVMIDVPDVAVDPTVIVGAPSVDLDPNILVDTPDVFVAAAEAPEFTGFPELKFSPLDPLDIELPGIDDQFFEGFEVPQLVAPSLSADRLNLEIPPIEPPATIFESVVESLSRFAARVSGLEIPEGLTATQTVLDSSFGRPALPQQAPRNITEAASPFGSRGLLARRGNPNTRIGRAVTAVRGSAVGRALAGVTPGMAAGVLAFGAAVGVGALALRGLARAGVAASRRVTEWSGLLLASQSRLEVGRTIRDINKARELGPAGAEFNDNLNRLEKATHPWMTAIERKGLEIAAGTTGFAADAIENPLGTFADFTVPDTLLKGLDLASKPLTGFSFMEQQAVAVERLGEVGTAIKDQFDDLSDKIYEFFGWARDEKEKENNPNADSNEQLLLHNVHLGNVMQPKAKPPIKAKN